MPRIALVALGLALLIGLQLVIGSVPTQLARVNGSAPPAAGYRLTQTGPTTARLVLSGVRNFDPDSLHLVPVSEATHVYPIGRPNWVINRGGRTQTVLLHLEAPLGTYKLSLAGARPFGLVSVGVR